MSESMDRKVNLFTFFSDLGKVIFARDTLACLPFANFVFTIAYMTARLRSLVTVNIISSTTWQNLTRRTNC